VSGVRTPALAYNNACPYQLSYAHGDMSCSYSQEIHVVDFLKVLDLRSKEVVY